MQTRIQKRNIPTKSRISALLPNFLLEEVEKTSRNQKLTKSYIIERALQDWFHRKLDSDTKELSKISFDDLPSEKDWNLIQSQV